MDPAKLIDTVASAFLGQRQAIELAAAAFAAGGHLLLEDVPGVGKTTLARALARTTGGDFRRIQFTSDLLPTDITGISIWDAKVEEFRFKPGPLFANIVLADEINRATPKTQSALLEAMSERQVSVDGVSWALPAPFVVIATQNVQEMHGTYPLPESQLDRFMMRISLGYPERAAEREIVSRPSLNDPVEGIEPILGPGDYQTLAAAVDAVRVDETVLDYLMAIVQRTRTNPMVTLGVGPRAGMALHRAARALAFIRGRSYALADDVKELALPVLTHRLVPRAEHGSRGNHREVAAQILREILESVEIPL